VRRAVPQQELRRNVHLPDEESEGLGCCLFLMLAEPLLVDRPQTAWPFSERTDGWNMLSCAELVRTGRTSSDTDVCPQDIAMCSLCRAGSGTQCLSCCGDTPTPLLAPRLMKG
jgi:hypothetical protein